MKKEKIVVVWEKICEIEVPDDWKIPDNLDGFSEKVLEGITSDNAWIIDWAEYVPQKVYSGQGSA